MQTGAFLNNKKTGLWRRYHPNGALHDEGENVEDRRVGEWKTYDDRGNLTRLKKFK
jgi:antitoxin component YwqK of YwqJK toxin-antitoxin module